MDAEEVERQRRRRESERLRLLAESAHDFAMMTMDAEGRFDTWSAGAERVLGYAEAEVLGRHGSLIFTPEDVAAGVVEQEMRAALLNGRAADERLHRRKDGSLFWASGVMSALRDGAGDDAPHVGFAKILRDLTWRKAAEDALRDNERRFRAAVEYAAVGVGLADAAGDLVYANAALRALLGLAADADPDGMNLLAITHPDDRAESAALLERLWSGAVPHVTREQRRVRADGATVWVRDSVSLLPDPGELSGGGGDSGAPAARLVVLSEDVTARRSAEAALRESEERLRLATDAARMGTWAYDTATGRLEASPLNLAIFGFDADGPSPPVVAWHERIHPDDRGRVIDAWRVAFAAGDGALYAEEYRALLPDGTVRWIASRGRVHADGARRRLVGVSTDVTDRRRADARLRESEERFRAVADLVPDLLWYHDADFGNAWYNRRWAEYTGLDAGRARGFDWTEVLHPDDRGRVRAAADQSFAAGEPFGSEARVRGAEDGRYRWFLIRAEPARDPETGRVARWYGAATDIDDQKRAASALEERVAERTRALDATDRARRALVRRLVHAQEEERARISRDVHDELGRHVTALSFGIGALREAATGAIRDPGRAAQTLDRLETVLAELAQTARRVSFDLRPLALDDIGLPAAVGNYLEEWRRWSGLPADVEVVGFEGNRRLRDEVETTAYRVIQEALTNVLRHAVPAGATRVSVVLQVRAAGDGGDSDPELAVTVEDDGPGFDAEAALAPGEREVRRLGLYGMRERVELVGGTFTVESAPGGGATVYARLPL